MLPAIGAATKLAFGKLFEFVAIDFPWDIEMKKQEEGVTSDFLGYGIIKSSLLDRFDLRLIQINGYILCWTVN